MQMSRIGIRLSGKICKPIFSCVVVTRAILGAGFFIEAGHLLKFSTQKIIDLLLTFLRD